MSCWSHDMCITPWVDTQKCKVCNKIIFHPKTQFGEPRGGVGEAAGAGINKCVGEGTWGWIDGVGSDVGDASLQPSLRQCVFQDTLNHANLDTITVFFVSEHSTLHKYA